MSQGNEKCWNGPLFGSPLCAQHFFESFISSVIFNVYDDENGSKKKKNSETNQIENHGKHTNFVTKDWTIGNRFQVEFRRYLL